MPTVGKSELSVTLWEGGEGRGAGEPLLGLSVPSKAYLHLLALACCSSPPLVS